VNETLDFLFRHRYAVLFAVVYAEQIGLPVPAVPVLLAAGAMAGMSHLSLPIAVLVAVVASLLSDLIWYELGRRRGHAVLRLLCKISLEPDSCIRRTEDVFARHGVRALLVAKFVPGLNTAAPPLAGMFQMGLGRFVMYDGLGAVLWVATFCGAGYLFSAQLEQLAAGAARLGIWLAVILVSGLAAYIAWKFLRRRRFIQRLRTARVTPEDLMRALDAREPVAVVDLRHSLDRDADSVKIPGALHMLPEEMAHRHSEIPRDLDIVLYCT
jgi:membrane protein DedA with SNARE-associated domain